MFLRLALISLAAALSLPACGPACNRGAICSVENTGKDETVCDGNGFVSCTDKNRGQVIACENKALEAVCSPSGWSFEPGTQK